MPTSFEDLEEKISLVAQLVPLIQIDVMDGRLTPKRTWPYLGADFDRNFVRILSEDEGFPFWNDVDFEVDLMIREPEKVWRDWVKAGAKRLIFHMESVIEPKTFLDVIRKSAVAKESPLYTEIGFALGMNASVESVYPFVEDIDFVQLMGIADIGIQGSDFDERVFEKITDLHTKYPDLILSVDGGVSLDVAPKLIEAGVKRLVVGSAIFAQEDVPSAVSAFEHLFA